MKTLIKKWLGIEAVEKTPPISKEELRLMVGEAFRDALSGAKDHPMNSWYFQYDIPNTLTMALESAANKVAGDVAMFYIDKRIESEKFIDEIVARIQRKQLG